MSTIDEASVCSARLLVGVMTCPANRDREKAVRATWMSEPLPSGIAVIFVEGGAVDTATLRLLDQRLTLPVIDAYELLPRKTRAFFKWAILNTTCDHILKCDDDSYLHLAEVAQLNLESVDYAGRLTSSVSGITEKWHYGKCTNAALEVPFRGPIPDLFAEGFGYFVSRRAASLVAAADEQTVSGHILEDVFVGCCLARKELGIVRKDLTVNVCARKHVEDTRDHVYVRHPLFPEQMLRLYHHFAGLNTFSPKAGGK